MSARRQGTPVYAELDVTTNFTFLRGGSHAEELVATAKALGLAAIAITDRNTLAGVVRAHLAAKEVGLQLIVGARLDLTDAPSLICLPTDREAYARLSRLLTLGQRRAEKGKCLIGLADVAAHAEGQILIALSPEGWNWREVLPAEAEEEGEVVPFTKPAREATKQVAADRSFKSDLLRLRKDLTRAVGKATTGLKAPTSSPSPVAPEACLRHDEGEACLRHDEGEGRGGGGVENAASASFPPFQAPKDLISGALKPKALGLPPQREKEEDTRPLKNAECDHPGAAGLYLAASHAHHGDDRARMAALARLAEETGVPLVATGAVLYHTLARRELQDVLTAIREKVTVATAGFRLEANAERHLKSPAEMRRLFKGYEQAIARTAEIAQACRFSLDELVYEYPDEPVPHGKTPQGHLEDIAWEGAAWRYPDGVPETVRFSIERELRLIAELRYAPYFLTVHDIVTFARSRGILCQGRGSAANSAVCYCIGITNVNPAEIDLLFERFISPERQEPPDIDVDFEHERREEVIQYIYARYGRDRAGLAATVISYRARSAVREVGKAMGLSEDTVAALAGMVWGTRSGGVLPETHVREAGLDPADPLLARTLALAAELSGFPRHLSQHVGGFVLTRRPLSEVVPIGNAAMEDRTNIEWDKDDLDALGLLKVDVLGLGMLSCIRKGFELLERHYGETYTLGTVPREDPAVYDMLCRADSLGVFQVESRAQMNMLPRLKPRKFYDLVIEVAIVRPGPIQGDMVHPYLRRRDGLEPEDYPSPAPPHDPNELRNILGKTRGVPLFQEQAMRIAMVAAEFSPAEANELRRAMATFRRRGTIGLLEEKMVQRMVGRGYDPEFAQRCFNQIKGFGEYGFPESHAASFAHLVYVSSWLKCHYPDVFATALLNSQPMGFYAPAQIVRDAREHGVEVRPADAGLSDWDSTLEPGRRTERWAMRLGLRQVDGLQEEEARRVVAARAPVPVSDDATSSRAFDATLPPPQAPKDLAAARPSPRRLVLPHEEGEKRRASLDVIASNAEGPLSQHTGAAVSTTLEALHRRSGVAISTLERLAAADAFRSFGLDRRQALWQVKALVRAPELPLFAHAAARELVGEPEAHLPAMPLSEHVVADYQTLRLSLKAHPMCFLRDGLREEGIVDAGMLKSFRDGQRVAYAGVVLVRQRPGSAKGVVFMTLEDEMGVANSVVWPNMLERFRKVVMSARLILVKGVVQRHQDIIHIVAQYLEDRSDGLRRLADDGPGLRLPIANADEVVRPEPGSARGAAGEGHPRLARHPREVRILPRSRDFH
ncbi:MAG: error-prone DNA polymerase [Hyphomicrobiaceae bacterium]